MKNYFYFLVFLILLILSSCKDQTETTSPKMTKISESVYASGFVKSVNQYELFTKTSGIIENVFVREGAYVTKGDPIFQIAFPNARYNLNNARLVATANEFSKNRSKIEDAQKSIDLARRRMVNDSVLFTRQQLLWNQNLGSKNDLEQKELSYENSKVNFERAQLAYDDLSRQLKLASDQSKNNLDNAQMSENDLIIRSDLDGVVYKINIQQGELANIASPLAVIGQKNFILELSIDEFDVVKIEPGQKVIIRMDSYQNQVFHGRITYVYPMMNERTRTFKVEAVFSNSPKLLYPNLTLEANIVINEKSNVLTIPTRFLLNDSTVILENGTKRKVKIGLKDYTLCEIKSGIGVKDKITMPE